MLGPRIEYMKSLLALQISLGQISGSTPDPIQPLLRRPLRQPPPRSSRPNGQGFGVDPLAITIES